jgi:6-phosphogluconolactonase
VATGYLRKRSLNTPPKVQVLEDVDALARTGAGIIADLAAEVTAKSSRHFAIALAGGSTPRHLYEKLAAFASVDWANWEVFWGDERWVAADDRDSNARMAQESLLGNVGIPSDQIHPVPTHLASPEKAAESYAEELIRVLGPEPIFDLVLLGLGLDGHTASLFPGAQALDEIGRSVVANSVPGLDTYRITFTFPTINQSRHVLFIVSGLEKAPMVRRVLQPTDGDAPVPAAGVRPGQGALRWVLDRDAASQLTPAATVSGWHSIPRNARRCPPN